MRTVNPILGAAVAVGVFAAFVVTQSRDRPSPRDDAAAPGALRAASGERTADEALRAYRELPLAFVENRGQIDETVRFYLQGSRSAFFLTREGIVLSLTGDDEADPAGTLRREPNGPELSPAPGSPLVTPSSLDHGPPGRRDAVALGLRFVGATPSVAIEGQERAPGVANFLRGADPARWHTDVPRYARIVYRDLWPGIDLVVRARAAELKYEFVVRPGARPSDIRLAYAGADRVTLDRDGALLVETAVGTVRDAAPVSWQDVGGERIPVESRYLPPRADGEASSYGFAVGAYDPAEPLVIDPGVDYSTFLGGSSMDRAGGVAVDSAGNAYVVGTTQSTDFPTTTGAFDRTFSGGLTDVFVAKLDAAGSGLVYATYIGGVPTPLRRGTGDNLEFGRAVAVDAGGNAYVTGVTDSSDFPTTGDAFQPALNVTPDMATDAFVAKLNPSGSGFVYSTFLGGSGYDDGWAIAVDGEGNAYVTGDTGSSDLPVTPGAAQSGAGGGRDAFVTKLNATGSTIVYSTHLGGADNEVGNGIALDGSGAAHVVGGTRSADFPATPGALQPSHNGGDFATLFDAFATKLDGMGALVYSTFLGGSNIDIANGVAVDGAGQAYVVGSTSSTEFPTTAGAFDTASRGGFVAKLDASGSALVYSTFLGGAGAAAVAVDADDQAWVVGTASAGAPTTPDAFAPQNGGGSDAWLAQLSQDGSALRFATFLGGGNSDNGVDVALGGGGAVYVAGTTISFDFPTTAGALDTTFGGDPAIFWGDAFVARFGAGTGTVEPTPTRTTSEFSGSLDRNQTAVHTVQVGSAGDVDLDLDWSDGRANLTLRVRDGAGAQVFFDGSTAKPKTGTFSAASAGSYQVEVSNPSRRRTSYSLSVTHPFASSTPAAVALLTLDPTTVAGGTSSTGRVSLTAGAPSGGAVVALSSSNPAAASPPASVTVPAGQTSATFTVLTSAVEANTTATITATYNGTSRSATLGVNAADGPALSTLTLQPTSVQGGSSSMGTATLTGPAPAGGAVVALTSSNTAVATVPGSVTVPGGQTSATFTVSTSPQDFDQSSAISASHGGVTRTVILSVVPGGAEEPPPSGTTAILTVTATGRSGERILSSPAGISVSVGSTGSASFPVGTSITLSVSNGRDAVWSGACSSGGEKTRTCVFTLNGDASVTGNVQ